MVCFDVGDATAWRGSEFQVQDITPARPWL